MKILEVCAKLNIGGAQAVAASIAKYALEDMEFVYVVFGDDVGEYEADIITRGNRVIHIPSPAKGKLKFFRNLIKIMKAESFDVVHCHTMYSCGTVMLAARLCGIKGRISHSHTAKDEAKQTAYRKFYKMLMRFFTRSCGTEWLSCGLDAGNELYGEKLFSKRGMIIKNGIDISKYAYSEETAEAIKKKYNVGGKFIIGHVGHYVNVKNQAFLIEMMPEIIHRKPDAVLLMFGEGDNRAMLETLIKEKHMEKHAHLMGNVNNINEVLSAFDMFAFPSLYEGTPLSLIEAQANGVPCLISDRIPDDACLTDLITKLPIENYDCWIEHICSAQRNNPNIYATAIREKYEDIQASMKKLYEIFRKYDKDV